MKKANRITVIVIAAVLVPLAVLVAVFSFIKNDNSFNMSKEIYQAQIAKEGILYSSKMSGEPGKSALVSDANKTDKYEKFVDGYYSLTSFSVMRGIVEGKWFPKAKLEEVVEADAIRGLKAGEGEYLVTLDYETLRQNAEIKVKKGTKESPNSIKIGDTVYKEGEKVAFGFTTVVAVVGENQFINDFTLYAFEKADLVNGEPDFVAYKIILKANQIKLYQACKEILP